MIIADSATPGYLPGEPEDGVWQVMIGLHRLPPEGADYRVTIEVSTTPGELSPDDPPDSVPRLDDRPARRVLPGCQDTGGWPATCTLTRSTQMA